MAKWSRIGSDILLFVSCLVCVGDEREWLIACIRGIAGVRGWFGRSSDLHQVRQSCIPLMK